MHREKTLHVLSGWLALVLDILMYLGTIPAVLYAISEPLWGSLIGSGLLLAAILVSAGFFIVNPNEAIALLLFGSYKGTCRDNGFRWANPFLSKLKISLKARNFNSDKLKVNDITGNPIEIAAVVVWRVHNTAQALFDVEDYEEYVTTQSESAVRQLASSYAYDGGEDEISLRGSTEEINSHLKDALQERLKRAGVAVIEARLSHLAYAPEIAGAMLQRQQATAVVAARKKIVEGAVGMVEMALLELNKKQLVKLDEERKAAMVSNLLVVLCSEHSAQPVVNTGTLYQ